MKVVVFEDEQFENLYPLTYLRPVFELKCGHISLRQRIERVLGNFDYYYFTREYLAPVFKKKLGQDKVNKLEVIKNENLLFINGRLLAIDFKLGADGAEEIGMNGDAVVYIRTKKETVQKIKYNDINDLINQLKSKLPSVEVKTTLINYPWNLVQNNIRAIKDDFNHLQETGILGEFSPQAAIIGDKNLIYVHKTSSIRPFATLDTTNGPIIIDKNVIVHPMSHIEGPAALGEDTQVFGGNIREGCAIGPVCRIHGEIEESIIHGYANKHHDGFLGHAYLGEWVNLGAFTTNSDLKNDYTPVKLMVKGELVDSGDMKVGSFIGDHTKTSIGTIINTGAMIGVMNNVVNSGSLIPKFLPSFCWYLNNKVTKGFGITHMIKSAATSMSRRKVEFTPEDEEMLRFVYSLTKEERKYWIKKSFRG